MMEVNPSLIDATYTRVDDTTIIIQYYDGKLHIIRADKDECDSVMEDLYLGDYIGG